MYVHQYNQSNGVLIPSIFDKKKSHAFNFTSGNSDSKKIVAKFNVAKLEVSGMFQARSYDLKFHYLTCAQGIRMTMLKAQGGHGVGLCARGPWTPWMDLPLALLLPDGLMRVTK